MARILLIDDKENIRTVMGAIIRREGYICECAASGEEALRIILSSPPDLIISDVRMDGMSGMDLFRELWQRGISLPFIFLTAFANVPDAVEAIQNGAIHYLTKPVDYSELLPFIRKILAKKSLSEQRERSSSRRIIGSGPAIRDLLDRIEAVSGSDATVLIRGENGTGKELAARALHQRGQRRDKPFIPVNCAALNPNLFEAELFGHEAGAFTNAIKRRSGYFEVASGGTLFLDEISEISLDIQVKLLRVLQERAFSRVGSTELIQANFRLLAATNKDLESMVLEGSFRSDLYYRLDVVPLRIPPLRERQEDMGELIDYFVQEVTEAEGMERPEIEENFLSAMKYYSWPGNIRELENLIERLLVLYKPKLLNAALLKKEAPERFAAMDRRTSKEDEILIALEQARGNRSEAARILGISRRTLYYRLENLGIQGASGAPEHR